MTSSLCNPNANDWLNFIKQKKSAEEYQKILDQLSGCADSRERLQLIETLDDVSAITQLQGQPFVKSDAESSKAREEGNQLFKKREYNRALKMYNRSVMLARMNEDTETLALAFANRSAVLQHMKQYRLSLQDISSALEYGYPAKLRHKLYERRGRCHTQFGELEEARGALNAAIEALKGAELEMNKVNTLVSDYSKQIDKLDDPTLVTDGQKREISLRGLLPQLEGKGKPDVISISNAVSVSYDEKSGRGLYANKDIDVGDLMIIEKPYCSTVLKGLNHAYCHHCSSRVIAPLPCLACSAVVFCDDQCRSEAWAQYHRFECAVLHNALAADIGLGQLALKMVLKAGAEYLCNIKAENVSEEEVAKQFDGNYDWDDYKSVHRLVNHEEDRDIEDLFKRTMEAYYLARCVEKSGFLGDGKKEMKQCVVGGHIMRNLMMLPCNAHECSELALKEGNLPESVTLEVGSAIYPCLSLINHSCDPNIVRHSYKNVCVVRAIRNIPKGSEILDNYGALCALTPTAERRAKLELQYFFTCHCMACTDDYPQYLNLPSATPVFKCDSCSGPVFMPMTQKYSDVPCACCKLSHDLAPRLGSLSESDEGYRGAMMEVLTGTGKNLTENIVTLEGHLQLMDRLICRPWRDFNDCQEALKQCYACRANSYPAHRI